MDMKSANDEDDAKKTEKTKYGTMEHAFWIEIPTLNYLIF